jgi:tetratricopeptide (TPR) repeat protein
VRDWRALGSARVSAADWKGAAEAYENAIKLDATSVSDWVWLGNARAHLRQRAEAQHAYDQAEKIDRNDHGLLNALAKFHGEGGDVARALQYAERGVELHPGDAHLWNAKGYSLIRLRRHKEAIAPLVTATRLQSDLAAAWINLGQAQLGARDLGNAIRTLSHALTLSPNAADARFYLAQALAYSGQLQPAQEQVERVLKQVPELAPAWYVLGLLGAARQDAEQVRLALERLQTLSPKAADMLRKRIEAHGAGAAGGAVETAE